LLEWSERYLFFGIGVCRWEEPEEQTGISMGRVGQQPRIALANVKGNLREMLSVDKEFYGE
jgi:hypothetical protein